MPVDIKVEFRKRVTDGGAAGYAQAISSMSFALATQLARSIKQRVADYGKPAQQFHGYAKFKPGHDHSVAPGYLARAESMGIVLSTGVISYASSEEFHKVAGVVPGSYNVTGGMWAGLNVVSYGSSVNKVEFRGRSTSRRPSPASVRRGKARPIKLSNSKKASTVLQATGVNVLSLTELEFSQIEQRVVAGYIQYGISSISLANIEWPKAIESVQIRG